MLFMVQKTKLTCTLIDQESRQRKSGLLVSMYLDAYCTVSVLEDSDSMLKRTEKEIVTEG